jgi:hypothetical protein
VFHCNDLKQAEKERLQKEAERMQKEAERLRMP